MNEAAEKIARISAEHDGPIPGWVVRELLAELDRRGEIEQRARKEATIPGPYAVKLAAQRILGERVGNPE